MISNYLLSFNSANESNRSSDSLIEYLDERYPDWRTLIVEPKEFLEFFKTEVHVYQNSWLKKIAEEIFNIVSDKNLIESVWKDSTINEWYRYTAIRRLVSIEPDTYITLYSKELLSGGFNLGGWGYAMVSELYDFPNSVELVLKSDKRLEGNNLEFLAQKACEYFDKYPVDVRNKILTNRDYLIRKNCNQAMWNIMTNEEKIYLTSVIVANEYAKFHDVVTYANFIEDQDESKLVLFTNEFSNLINDIVRHTDSDRHRIIEHQVANFDCPEYDETTHQYTPSEQLSRFLAFAQTDENRMPYDLLKRTSQELSHSYCCFGNN